MTNDFAGNFHGKVLFDTSRLKKVFNYPVCAVIMK